MDVIEEKNAELDELVASLQGLVDSGDVPFDDGVLADAKSALESANSARVSVGDIPTKTEDIIAKTQKLNTPVDYADIITRLTSATVSFKNSVLQLKQVTNPTEAFVIERLRTIDEIGGVQAVTEENDPNGNLNKPGGYTATVYFESKNVDQSSVFGSDIIDKGTEGGGSVEVYASADDARKRNDYLAVFDGSILASGSHTVVGTTIVRTSDQLTATQQKALEKKIIDALIAIG